MIQELFIFNYVEDNYFMNNCNLFDQRLKPFLIFGGLFKKEKYSNLPELRSVPRYTIKSSVNENICYACNNILRGNCQFFQIYTVLFAFHHV